MCCERRFACLAACLRCAVVRCVAPASLAHAADATADGLPSTLQDGEGRFLKRLQAGQRAERELAFYNAMELAYERCISDDSDATDVEAALARWVPRSYGCVQMAGAPYLALADAAAGYRLPAVLDIKVGRSTAYAWAEPELQRKCRAKDATTTQATLGFRLCGCIVHDAQRGGTPLRRDRHWGKALTPKAACAALAAFADNGYLSLTQLLQGEGMLLEQLQCLWAVAARQDKWHLYSSSLLLLYEGAARCPTEAKPRLRIVDFAHAFPVRESSGPASATATVATSAAAHGVDVNFLAGLDGLIESLQLAAAG